MSLSVNGFNVGTDASFVVTDNLGDVFFDDSLGHLMDFSTEAVDQMIKVQPITRGGVPVFQTTWNGGTGHMMYSRFGPTFQQMFLDLAAAYHASGIIPQFNLQLGVRNRSMVVDTYLYTGVQFTQPKFGNFRASKEVDMSVNFGWSTCTGTGALASFLSSVAQAA